MIFLLLLLSAPAFAQDDSIVCREKPLSPFHQAEEIARIHAAVEDDAIDWWSASPKQIKNAPCRRTAPFTEAEISQGIKNLIPPGDKKISKNIFGIQIENESEYLTGLLDTLLRYHDMLSKLRPDPKDQKTFSSSCKTVICAVNDPNLFPPKVGNRLLYMLGRFGFNGSPHATFNSDQWTTAELDDVMMGLSDLPPTLVPMEKSRQLTHFKRGATMAIYGPDGDKTLANSMIFMFDTWNEADQSHRQSAVVHEVGHYAAHVFDLDENPTWLKLSDWSERTAIENGRERRHPVLGNPRATVSKYGQTNPAEDFAETVVAYRYNPKFLKARSPEKYQYLKETIFDGLEYTSPTACDPANANSKKLLSSAGAMIEGLKNDSAKQKSALGEIKRSCGAEIFKSFSNEAKLSLQGLGSADSCITKAIKDSLLKELLDNAKFDYPEQALRAALKLGGEYHIDETALAQIKGSLFEDLKSKFQEFMKKQDENNNNRYAIQKFAPTPAEEFCSQYSKYSYQNAEQLFDQEFGEEEYFSYSNSPLFDNFAKKACLDMHGGSGKISPPGADQISQAVNKRFED